MMKLFKHLKTPREFAEEWNRLTRMVEMLANSILADGIMSGGQILKRRVNTAQASTQYPIRIFEVQSEAIGDGIYNCYQQSLDTTEWDDTAGDDKLDDKNEIEVEVLNLMENNPAATYAAGLIAGDRMACWQEVADEGELRWIGIPLLSSTRNAKIQGGGVPANAIGPFTCKLLGAAGTEVGNTISVYPRQHLGSNDFDSGDVHPNYAAADYMPVFLAMNGKWYTHCVFEDTIDCVCTEP